MIRSGIGSPSLYDFGTYSVPSRRSSDKPRRLSPYGMSDACGCCDAAARRGRPNDPRAVAAPSVRNSRRSMGDTVLPRSALSKTRVALEPGPPQNPSRERVGRFAGIDHGHAVDEHVVHAHGQLIRFLEGCHITDLIRI